MLKVRINAGMCLGLLILAAIPLIGADRRSPSRKEPVKPATDAKLAETLAASSAKSVVVITHYGRNGKEDGVGAGFIVGADGLIATSLHVIGEARPIKVRLPDGKRYDVTEVYASDRKFDLALIRIAASKLPALSLGDSDALKQGAPVVAIGNPLGLEHSVVQGVVSAKREVEGAEMIQIAIPIEPGNSGGPLLDAKGRVQGILTLKSAVTANLGFAMPVNLLKTLIDKPNPVPMSRWLTLGALNPKDWTPVFGARWSQKAGRVLVEGVGQGFGGRALCLWKKPPLDAPFEVAVSVKLDDESGAAGLIFGADGEDRHFGFYPSAGQLRLTRFDGPNVYSWSILRQVPTPHYRPGDWNHLRVRVESKKIFCYVNDELVTESDAHDFAGPNIGLAKFRETRAEFKGFEVGTNLSNITGRAGARLPESVAQQISSLSKPADDELLTALKSHQPAGPAALNGRARQLEQEAARLRQQAATLHREAVQSELLKVMQGAEEKIDLFHAALLVAQLDNPELDVRPYRQQLDDMAAEIRAKLAANDGDMARLEALKKYLFNENGFHGSRSDYYNRANSYINEVLDDREGLPITLSILFLELAHRLGVKGMAGLPLPGHFMVRYSPRSGDDQIIDVFNGGRTISRSEAQERVFEATGDGFRDADYTTTTKREIIVRMLRNLIGVSERSESAAGALRYQDLIVALQPEAARERLTRARMRLQSGDTPGAKQDLKWLLDGESPGVDLERIAELYRSL